MKVSSKPITIKCAICGEEYEIYPLMSMFVLRTYTIFYSNNRCMYSL